MNKKSLFLMIIVALVLLLAITGCGKKQTEQKETEDFAETTEQSQENEVIIGEGVISGVEVEEEEPVEVDKGFAAYEDPDPTASTKPSVEKPSTPSTQKPTTPSTQKPTTPVKPSTPTTPNQNAPTTPTQPEAPAATEPEYSAGVGVPDEGVVTEYDEYMNMSADEQQAFIESFESMEAFMTWFNKAQEEENASDNSIEIGSGVIDMTQISGKK